MHTLAHYYIEFAHGNPGGFVFLHAIVLLIIAVIVHEWLIDGAHVHIFDPDSSLQIRDISGEVTHLLCTHPMCHKWNRMEDRNG